MYSLAQCVNYTSIQLIKNNTAFQRQCNFFDCFSSFGAGFILCSVGIICYISLFNIVKFCCFVVFILYLLSVMTEQTLHKACMK
jgi:hypothetical protein